VGILEKCEKIGIALRATNEGQNVLNCLDSINKSPQEQTVEFFKLINTHYTKVHFYSVQNAIDILKANVNNSILGALVKNILSIDDIYNFAELNLPLGHFVEKLSALSFDSTVKYQLPTDIGVTPELIRLSNALTVECQRINLIQQFHIEYQTNPQFLEAVKRFDNLRGTKPIVPFSRDDRQIVKSLKKEYPDTRVELLHSLFSILTYIKCAIFDSFYDNVVEIHELDDVVFRKEKRLNGCNVIKLVTNPTIKTLNPNNGWLLKLHNSDNHVMYAQIFHKKIQFSQTEFTITIEGLIHDCLQ